MASRQAGGAVRHKVLVQAPAARAFSVFTEGLGRWWPREYSWSRRVLDPKQQDADTVALAAFNKMVADDKRVRDHSVQV